jgi:hypothetical protein
MPTFDIAKKPHPKNFNVHFCQTEHFRASQSARRLDPMLGQSESTLFRPD